MRKTNLLGLSVRLLAVWLLAGLFLFSCSPKSNNGSQPVASDSLKKGKKEAPTGSTRESKTLMAASRRKLPPKPLVIEEVPEPQLRPQGTDRAGKPFKALSVTDAKITTQIVGMVAKTRTTMTFYNPHGRALEGEFVFPLPEDVTVSGYALDIQGAMVDAVAVGKEKARVVFEKEVRKGVDPGIVEWVGGNSFRTRVYPIPSKGSRTIAVETIRLLQPNGDNALWRLPLVFQKKLTKLQITLEIPNFTGQPEFKWLSMPALNFTATEGKWEAIVTKSKEAIAGEMVVALPATGRSLALQTGADSKTHFVISDDLEQPALDGAKNEISKLVIYWDASHSRHKADHAKVLDAFGHYFKTLAQEDLNVELVPFSNALRKTVSLQIKAGDITPLRQATNKIIYDGGTQMAAISPKKGDASADLYFLVSDGLSTFGHSEPSGFAAPIHTVSVNTAANTAFLRFLAESTGGAYFNLATQKPEVLKMAVAESPFQITALNIKEGEVKDMIPAVGQPVVGPLKISGELLSDKAILEVELGYGGKSLVRQTYTLEKSHATHGTVIARLWAQQKLGRLAAFPEKNSEKILALGKYYNLVTPRTSLIVLESLSQYIEHDIRPPASLKKMRAKFDENAQSLKKRLAIENESKLERIIKLWEGRKAWWNKVFEHKVIKPKAKPKKMMAQPRRSRRSEASKSMAAPSSAPMGAMAEEMESDAPAEMKKEAAGGPSDGPSIAIELKKWEPDTPYLRKMKAAKKDEAYNIYLSEKGGYGSSPAFYLDCADFFYTAKMDKIALRVLSTVAELKLEDAALIRVLAHRLAQLEHYEESRLLFEQVLQWRPEEPQSWRDLALVLDKSGKYERAMELLAHVVMKRWDRFNEIELIALMELNNIIPRAKKAGITHFPIDKRLIALLDVDIRISLSWDADLTDIDMWVIEPSGEKAYYGHRNTRIGGLVSRDFTQGYGPEEYLIHRAMKGTYKVQTNYFGSGAQTLTGAVTLQLELFTNYGRPNEQRQAITLRLSENKETITVGELKF